MDEIVAFLEGRLAEDEKPARKLCKGSNPAVGIAGQWDAYIEGGNDGWAFEDNAANGSGAIVGSRKVAEHIARHDPRRVLREAQAKRHVIEECKLLGIVGGAYPGEGGPESATHILRHLAAAYGDHPDYRPEWAFEP